MLRKLFITLLLIASFSAAADAQAQSGFAIGPSMSASWFNPDESGHGILIHLLDAEVAWLCWFTFDLDGKPAWICGLGSFVGDTILIEEAFTVEGGNFPPLFDPEKIVQLPWGSILITFSGCDNGQMEWTTDAAGFQSGSMPLIRLTRLWGNECKEPAPDTELIIPRSSIVPALDGTIGPGEWDDAVEVQITINDDWIVPVSFKSDGMNIYVLFSNVSGPNDENRVLRAGADTTFPELFFDTTPQETAAYDGNNHWFHASFQDCHNAGVFRVISNCNGTLPGWVANNWPLGATGDHIEISIEYGTLLLTAKQNVTVRLFATMTSSLLGNRVYHNWPSGSIPEQSSTWNLVRFE